MKLRKEQEEEHVAAGGSLDDDLPLPKLSWVCHIPHFDILVDLLTPRSLVSSSANYDARGFHGRT